MRKQFVMTIESLMKEDKTLTLLLGDIGVYGFRNCFADYPDRTFNIGILEPATIGLAAGMSASGLNPVVHTIAPFLVERAFEQIKIDLGYQQLGCNLVSVGSSYDYAALGCTHHCPGDVGILQYIPNMEIVIPGTAEEFDILFRQAYKNNHATYFRLSERSHSQNFAVNFGKANLLKRGKDLTVVAFGPALEYALSAVHDLDVSLLYYSTINPFDEEAIRDCITSSKKLLVIEPFYSGTMSQKIIDALHGQSIRVQSIGVPRKFLSNYGTAKEHDEAIGFTSKNIYDRTRAFINEK
jgi:transketolase